MKVLSLGAALVVLVTLAACEAEAPPRGLEATCSKACEVQDSQCTRHQCRRGCNLVMDRLAENEGNHVLDCVEQAKNLCDDRVWARCATRIGPHADGGPPPPAPPPDMTDVEGD